MCHPSPERRVRVALSCPGAYVARGRGSAYVVAARPTQDRTPAWWPCHGSQNVKSTKQVCLVCTQLSYNWYLNIFATYTWPLSLGGVIGRRETSHRVSWSNSGEPWWINKLNDNTNKCSGKRFPKVFPITNNLWTFSWHSSKMYTMNNNLQQIIMWHYRLVPCWQGSKTGVHLVSHIVNLYTENNYMREVEDDKRRNSFNGVKINGHDL